MTDFDWRVLKELAVLRARFRDLAERALTAPVPPLPAASASFEPAVDVWQTENEVVIEAELPGGRAGNVEVKLEAGAVRISGELPCGVEDGSRFIRVERPRGRFQRVIPLPPDVDGEPHASMRRGVLEIRLPRRGGGRRSITVERGAP